MEITALKQIIGLQHGKSYVDAKGLRYGKVMIMTDQDQDGSHIKGLIMNYLHHSYPTLLRLPGFLLEFITPIVKARACCRPRPPQALPRVHRALCWLLAWIHGQQLPPQLLLFPGGASRRQQKYRPLTPEGRLVPPAFRPCKPACRH